MPIHGISDRPQRRIPRLGKLRLGIRNERGLPQKVDYFVCPPAIADYVGDKPKQLNVVIPTDDLEQWCSMYYRAYTRTRGLVCKGDGKKCLMRIVDKTTNDFPTQATLPANMMHWYDESFLPERYKNCMPSNVKVMDEPCHDAMCKYYQGKRCTEIANVQVMLPTVPGVGTWQIDTTSVNTMQFLLDEVAFFKDLFGSYAMIPMVLSLEPMESLVEETGKTEKFYCLHLRSPFTVAELAHKARISHNQYLIETPDETEGYSPAELAEDEAAAQAQAALPKPPVSEAQVKKDIIELWPDGKAPANTPAASTSPAVTAPAQSPRQSIIELEPIPLIDIPWLAETLKTLKWSERATVYLLKLRYHLPEVTENTSLTQCVCKLNAEQAAEYTKHVQDAEKKLEVNNQPVSEATMKKLVATPAARVWAMAHDLGYAFQNYKDFNEGQANTILECITLQNQAVKML